MANTKNLIWIIGSAIVAGLIAGLWMVLSPNLPESTATVTILRNQIEDEIIRDSSAGNRWVWLRDGMSLKEHIISDAFLKDQLKTEERNKSDSLRRLRNNISVEFTGADSSTYHISVKDLDPKFAQTLATSIVSRIKAEVIDVPLNQIATSIIQLEKLSKDGNTQAPAMIERLKVSRALLMARKDNAVRISKNPTPARPSNQKTPFVIFAAIILGAFAGLSITMTTKND